MFCFSEHEGKIKNSLDKESNRMNYAKFAVKEMVSYFPTYCCGVFVYSRVVIIQL